MNMNKIKSKIQNIGKAGTKEKANEKGTWLENRNVSAMVSLVIALVIWTYVTTVVDPNQSRPIKDVPVDFNYGNEIYTAKELDIVNNPEAKVTVHLQGDGANINNIRQEDLIVYPDYSLLTGPGDVDLPLQVRFVDSRKGRDIEAVTNDKVNIVFDSVEEKTFDIVPVVENDQMSVAEGYVLHSMICVPNKVTVRGPKTEIERISRVVAVLRTSGADVQNSLMELSDSKIATARLEAWDENDKPVELTYSVMDNELADVNINIYRKMELPLVVNFINVSPTFDIKNLKYSLSQQTMGVTGKSSVVSAMTEVAVSDFDLGNSFELNKVYQLNVQLPKGVSSKDNLDTVTLTFDSRGLTSKTVPVSNIRIANQPANMKIEPVDQKLTNVTLIGPEDVLAKLSPSSVVAVIDASSVQIADGTENLSAQIHIPAYSEVFAVGSYSVECQVHVNGGDN